MGCYIGVFAITGGGTVVVFLFGYLFALPIRKWVCDEDLQSESDTKERYFTQILRLLGLVVMVILWGSFSSATAAVDEYYLITSFGRVSSTALLTSEAFIHMHLGFMAAIGTTIGLRVMGEKIVLEKLAFTLFLVKVFLRSQVSSSARRQLSSLTPSPRFSWVQQPQLECFCWKRFSHSPSPRATEWKGSSWRLWEAFSTLSLRQVATIALRP